MILGRYYDGIEIHRKEKIIYVKFLSPHRVISTSRLNGGLSDELEYLFNHQSCEPAGHSHSEGLHKLVMDEPEEYRRLICEKHNLPPEKCAFLGTAANMNNASISHEKYRELEVIAVCTGGVETNAGRVGDTAAYYEKEGKFEYVGEKVQSKEPDGTINTMVFINQELIAGAMVRAVMTATEAKTAVLQELIIPSRYSDGYATGTGTDQIGIASRIGDSVPLTGAGKHTKLGELIGKTVHDAIKESLVLQNRLMPQERCSVLRHVERFGTNKEAMRNGIGKYLEEADRELLERNFLCIDQDPLTVAAVSALIRLRDEFAWGILPGSCLLEIFGSYGAQIVAAVSGKHHRVNEYRTELSKKVKSSENDDFLDFVYLSLARGFANKWDWPLSDEASQSVK
jgi:adenosylcobinamide amidohydrolase